jgi:transposase InsO family protein
MGGSESIGEYHNTNNPKILLAKHNLQIQVPRELTVDNGKQFDCYSFKEYCRTLGTHAKFSSVYHSQSNGAVERAKEADIFGESKSTYMIKRRESGRMNCRK